MTANSLTCQKCGSPVTPGMKFCESCGAKIEAVPVCSTCGAALQPGIRFCESCGAPAVPEEPVKTPVAEAVPVTAVIQETVPAALPVSPPASVSPETRAEVPDEPAAGAEEKSVPPAPAEKPAPASSAVKTPPKIDTAKKAPAEIGQKKPVSQTTMIIAGVVILALLGAAVYFVVLPMFSGSSGTPAGGQSVLPSLPSVVQNPSAVQTPAASAGSTTAGVSFVTDPTQVPPDNLLVTFQADRDPITGLITITFTGGGGRYGVQNVDVRLTRSDGQVVTRTYTIAEIGDGKTLEGTKTGDDRIEITANYFNGEHFKIIDKIFEYKKRNFSG
jgi:hypothetical protein